MRKAIKQIGVLAAALMVICLICRFAFFRSYTAYIPLYNQEAAFSRGDYAAKMDEPGVIRVGETGIRNGYLRVRITPEHHGELGLTFRTENGEAETPLRVLRVSRARTIYDANTGDFTGDNLVLTAVTLFWLAVSAIMIWHYRQAKGPAFYAYATIYYAGFFLFALVTGLTMARVTVLHMARPGEYNMLAALETINGASSVFMRVTTPVIIAFALAMAVSNVALLRHMRPRIQNVLGILIGILLIAGEALGWYLFTRNFSGSEWQGRVRSTAENTYATIFVYFECMLAGSVICGIQAARHQPEMNKDCIIILGCWFRPDGSLPPLLRGRVDRAMEFWREQKERTGREAILIPSGGRGRDETMAEAEAMKRYLVSQGVPEGLIRTEDRSKNTLENMAFSREIMAREGLEGPAAFATTNYHVFRSGIWAGMAGLKAEGIGSRTKWWFWPNAFMRETLGLLQKRWWQELLFLLILIGFFGLLSLVVG